MTRWSSAEDALFADLVKDDVGGDEESPEESEGAAGSHAALFDLSGSPYTRLRRSAPEPLRRQYSDDGEGSLEPSEQPMAHLDAVVTADLLTHRFAPATVFTSLAAAVGGWLGEKPPQEGADAADGRVTVECAEDLLEMV